jgi:transposase
MAYSEDLRKKVVEAYENGEGTLQEIADRFSIHKNTVNQWVQLYRETQSVTKRPYGGGRQSILSKEKGYDKLLELHQKQNNLTDEEYSVLLEKDYGITISRRAVNRAFSVLGLTKKKITFHAREQLREEVQEKIFEYMEEIEGIEASRFVFVDEAAANYSLVRLYGRAPEGERVYGRMPHYRGQRVSMIGALGFDGMRCGIFWDGYVDAEAFDIFVDDYLIPSLNPGDVVVWDNYEPIPLNREMCYGDSFMIEKEA